MDAPSHFGNDSWTVDEIPADRLLSPAVMVDIRYKASPENPDVNLTVGDLQEWERQHGRIPDRAVVFMCSGWGDLYEDQGLYWGNNESDISRFHFPGFEGEGAQWLVDQRRIVGAAVDTPSIDYGQSTSFESHVIFAANNVYGLENVKNACELPPKGAVAYVFPIKTESGSGGPTRIVAVWGDDLSGVFPAVTGSPDDPLTCFARKAGRISDWGLLGLALIACFA